MATAQAIEVQQGLNEVVMNRVHRMIDDKAVGVQATMERLVEEGRIAQDYIAPLGVNLRRQEHDPVVTFGVDDVLRMNMPDGRFSVHPNAVKQLADRMGIPQRYLLGLSGGLFGKENIMQKAIEIQAASEVDVDFERELKRLTKDGGLLKSEGEAVEKILMNNNPDDGVQGGATLWKLTQAITAHARELTPQRSRELHEISGALMNRVKITA